MKKKNNGRVKPFAARKAVQTPSSDALDNKSLAQFLLSGEPVFFTGEANGVVANLNDPVTDIEPPK